MAARIDRIGLLFNEILTSRACENSSYFAPILISPTPEATATLRMIVAEVTKEPAFERASVNCL